MEKLTLQRLSGYLPYGLMGNYELSDVVPEAKFELREKLLTTDNVDFFLKYAKPILRPLSDLTKEIEVNREKFVPIKWFEVGDEYNEEFPFVFGDNNIRLIKDLNTIAEYNVVNDINYMPYAVIQKLLEWHFDIYGLIEKGLAIDINTLK